MSISNINQYDIFKIGDKFKIIGKPTHWASKLNRNDPFNVKLKYSYFGTIIEMSHEGYYVAMTDGKFGWDLTDLIHRDLIIKIDIKKARRDKLNKIIYGS